MSYVSVALAENEESIEVPTEQDLTLLLSTLNAQFPNATGLKYRTEAGGVRGLRIADGKIDPPDSGWEDKVFIVVLPKETSIADNKRKSDDSGGNPTPKSKKFEKKCSDLIVLGLPWSTTEEDLREYFEEYGALLMSQVKRDAKTGRSKGFGFIRFTEISAQEEVLGKRHKIGDRWCDVRVPNSKAEANFDTHQNRKVFVGRCTEEMTAEDLRKYFSSFGEILDVFIPKPFRAFAFVTFQDATVANSLCGEDHIIKGVSVHVSTAVPREPGKGRVGRLEQHMPGGAWDYGREPMSKPAPHTSGWSGAGLASAGSSSLSSNNPLGMAGLNLGGFQVNPHALLAAAFQQNAMNILGQAMNPAGGGPPPGQSQGTPQIAPRDVPISQSYGSPAMGAGSQQMEEQGRSYSGNYQGWSGGDSSGGAGAGSSWSGKGSNWS